MNLYIREYNYNHTDYQLPVPQLFYSVGTVQFRTFFAKIICFPLKASTIQPYLRYCTASGPINTSRDFSLTLKIFPPLLRLLQIKKIC
jgi:hypothetical protein